MTEEEYEAELAVQEGKVAANVKEEEADLLTPQEVAAMKAKIESYAPWMNVDPEARARPLAARSLIALCFNRAPPPPRRPSRARRRLARTARTRRRRRLTACSSTRRRPS